jgi:hypothetical protein
MRIYGTIGDWINPDGTLTDGGRWTFKFRDKDIESVSVPSIGPIETTRRYSDDQYLTPLSDDWLDSPDVVRIMDDAGGREFRGEGEIPDLTLGFASFTRSVCWGAVYNRKAIRGHESLRIAISPDGSNIETQWG